MRGWFVFVVAAAARRRPRRDDHARSRAAGVQSKPYLPAIHLMSFYRERFGHREGEFPVCEDVAARSLALPFFPAMSEGAGRARRRAAAGAAARAAAGGLAVDWRPCRASPSPSTPTSSALNASIGFDRRLWP